MAKESNQPVYQRSSRLQAIIDLLQDEMDTGTDRSSTERLIEKANLDHEEKKQALIAALELDIARKEKARVKENQLSRIIIGLFLFVGGLFITIMTLANGGIVFLLVLATSIGGLIYSIIYLKAFRKESIPYKRKRFRQTKKY